MHGAGARVSRHLEHELDGRLGRIDACNITCGCRGGARTMGHVERCGPGRQLRDIETFDLRSRRRQQAAEGSCR